MKILSLFARHGTEKYADAHDTLKEYYAKHLPEAEVSAVIVDNALPEDVRTQTADGALVLGAPNTFWEFSAWDSALDALRPSLSHYDYVHFVTSAYRQLYTAYIDRIDMPMLGALLGRDVMVGHIDAYNDPVGFLGCTSQAWLRSSFLFASPAVLRRLGSIVGLRDMSSWFSGNPGEPFRADAPVSQEMRALIVSWLTGEGTGQGTAWHSRFQLNQEKLSYFEAKAFAILNENALSQRLLAQGTSLVDATWMSALLRESAGVKRASLTNWRSQLKERQPYL